MSISTRALYASYQRNRTLGHAISTALDFEEKVCSTPDYHPDKAIRLYDLGADHFSRYQRTGALSDLKLTIQRLQEAIDLTPENHSDRADWLQELGLAYKNQYRHTRVRGDLTSAIQWYQEALNLVPKGYSFRATWLVVLGDLYYLRWQPIGVLDDLEEGIKSYQEAVKLTPENHRDRATRVEQLGFGYSRRYLRFGAQEDLENAIRLFQEALDRTPTDKYHRSIRLQNLGVGYSFRYERNKARKDLEDAIRLYQEALHLTPHGHSDRAHRLQNLGTGHLDRYEITGAQEDLDNAIRILQEVLDLVPSPHVRVGTLYNLGNGYHDRYKMAKIPEDLENAIRNHQEAVSLTPDYSPARASRVQNLGAGYLDRYKKFGAPEDLGKALQRYHEALTHEPSPPIYRLRAGRVLYSQYADVKNWSLAWETVSSVTPLIPLLTLHFLEHTDRQHLVSDIVGLASDAAVIALKAGKQPYKALQVLESCRGIVVSSLSDLRTDITGLRNKYPDLAEQISDLRATIDTSKESRQGSSRYDTAKRLKELTQEITGLSSFDSILFTLNEDELKAAAVDGPIIVINASQYGCHAFIIELTELRALELPLQIEDIRTQAKNLASPDIEMLKWLWRAVASPVLNALNLVKTHKHTWPRVWWIPTGPLVRFPIHAAGLYPDDGAYKTVMDRVISSYSSSLRAIIDSRRNLSVLSNSTDHEFSSRGSIVLVGMEYTEGYTPLPSARKEVTELATLGASMQLEVKRLLLPCREDTLSAINGCKIFHFAGHGSTNSLDPSQSALMLRHGKLTVRDIFDVNLRSHNSKPFLAYLSACGTGQVKNDELLDEGLHIIGACQLAGFQHVIGTLWKVLDGSCVNVAKKTYEWIKEQDLSNNSVSEGLHRACMELRSQWARGETRSGEKLTMPGGQSCSAQSEKSDPRNGTINEDVPLYWVPYVHFGT